MWGVGRRRGRSGAHRAARPGIGPEERFYRLGMVRKERSWDALSLDRLSL